MLSAYQPAQVDLLCQACRDLAARRIEQLHFHEQPWVNAIDERFYYWQYSRNDVGVQLPTPGTPFVLKYSDEAWLEVEAKLAIMRDATPGSINELTMEGDVPVIISPRWQAVNEPHSGRIEGSPNVTETRLPAMLG